jgi:hypothetical protein
VGALLLLLRWFPTFFLLAARSAAPYTEAPIDIGANMDQEGAEYETPAVVDYGDLVELTAGSADGDFTDAAFPVSTPKRDLTFSG